MNKLLLKVAVFFVLSLGFAVGSQAGSIGQSGVTTMYDTTKLIGLSVQARDGVELGTIFNLLVDSQGHVDFAVVSQPGNEEFPGRLVAVPFESLLISQRGPQQFQVVLNADKEKFYEAKDWGDRDLSDWKMAADLDRYFGVKPYWTEERAIPFLNM